MSVGRAAQEAQLPADGKERLNNFAAATTTPRLAAMGSGVVRCDALFLPSSPHCRRASYYLIYCECVCNTNNNNNIDDDDDEKTLPICDILRHVCGAV